MSTLHPGHSHYPSSLCSRFCALLGHHDVIHTVSHIIIMCPFIACVCFVPLKTPSSTRRKLAWYWHVTRHDSLSKTILQGTVKDDLARDSQRRSCKGQSKALEGEADKERLGLITLKNEQASVFPLYCVLLRGEISGGLCVVMYPPWHPYDPLTGLQDYDDDVSFVFVLIYYSLTIHICCLPSLCSFHWNKRNSGQANRFGRKRNSIPINVTTENLCTWLKVANISNYNNNNNNSRPSQAMMTTASDLNSSNKSIVCAEMAERSNLGLEESATDSTWLICVCGHSSRLFALSGHTFVLCLIDSVSFCYTWTRRNFSTP
jgi:hypothetical protein